MSQESETPSGADIYQLLLEASKKKKREKRAQLLQSTGIKEFFEEGSISIDKRTVKRLNVNFASRHVQPMLFTGSQRRNRKIQHVLQRFNAFKCYRH